MTDNDLVKRLQFSVDHHAKRVFGGEWVVELSVVEINEAIAALSAPPSEEVEKKYIWLRQEAARVSEVIDMPEKETQEWALADLLQRLERSLITTLKSLKESNRQLDHVTRQRDRHASTIERIYDDKRTPDYLRRFINDEHNKGEESERLRAMKESK